MKPLTVGEIVKGLERSIVDLTKVARRLESVGVWDIAGRLKGEAIRLEVKLHEINEEYGVK
jgi:hypothetical protein